MYHPELELPTQNVGFSTSNKSYQQFKPKLGIFLKIWNYSSLLFLLFSGRKLIGQQSTQSTPELSGTVSSQGFFLNLSTVGRPILKHSNP